MFSDILIQHTLIKFENTNTDIVAKEQAELVHKLLGKLKLAHREIITLYFLESFSISEWPRLSVYRKAQ